MYIGYPSIKARALISQKNAAPKHTLHMLPNTQRRISAGITNLQIYCAIYRQIGPVFSAYTQKGNLEIECCGGASVSLTDC
jgi:hypothetical protein